jgi:hypothetical protein
MKAEEEGVGVKPESAVIRAKRESEWPRSRVFSSFILPPSSLNYL